MYTADPDLRNYIAERLTDAQTAFQPRELKRILSHLGDQRRERRFLVNEMATLYSSDPLELEDMLVQVVNVSRRGLGLASCQAVRYASNVRLHFKGMLVTGEVRYCEPAGETFHVGVEIESVLRRSGPVGRESLSMRLGVPAIY